jgi:hypothetical protein
MYRRLPSRYGKAPVKTQQQVRRVIKATEGQHLPFWQQRLQGGAP